MIGATKNELDVEAEKDRKRKEDQGQTRCVQRIDREREKKQVKGGTVCWGHKMGRGPAGAQKRKMCSSRSGSQHYHVIDRAWCDGIYVRKCSTVHHVRTAVFEVPTVGSECNQYKRARAEKPELHTVLQCTAPALAREKSSWPAVIYAYVPMATSPCAEVDLRRPACAWANMLVVRIRACVRVRDEILARLRSICLWLALRWQ